MTAVLQECGRASADWLPLCAHEVLDAITCDVIDGANLHS